MRASLLVLVTACSSATSPRDVSPDASPTGADAASGSPVVGLLWGERCGNDIDDDDDGLADEDCAPSLFTGVYAPQLAADPLLDAIEGASGRPLSVVQTYRSLSAAGIARIATDLATIFARGQVVHLNVEPSGFTAAQYAAPGQAPIAGLLDAMADAVAGALAANPRGRVLLTFGAEMNGSWTDWGCLPAAQFISLHRAAHVAVTTALAAAEIDTRRVRWVHGPNNVSSASCGSAAGYYPGHAYVDLLGMSAYRAQSDSVATTITQPMTALFDALAYPDAWRRSRFVVLQTGTRALADRASWLDQLIATSTTDDRIAGLLYFVAADWAAPAPALGSAFAAAPVADAALDGIFTPHFWDVPYDHPAFPEIQALRDAGITSGCATAPARFCPDAPVRTADARTLLARAFPNAASSVAALALPDPVTEADLAAAVSSLGGAPPLSTAPSTAPASRARAARIVADGANLRPAPL